MITVIQIIGALFGLSMCFLTFLNYKKNNFGPKSLFVWMCIWAGFMSIVFYPPLIKGFMDAMSITRTIDFFVIFGFFMFTVINFYMYIIVKKNERKVELLVRNLAIEKAPKKSKA